MIQNKSFSLEIRNEYKEEEKKKKKKKKKEEEEEEEEEKQERGEVGEDRQDLKGMLRERE